MGVGVGANGCLLILCALNRLDYFKWVSSLCFESDFVSIQPPHRIVHSPSTILNWQSARLFICVFIIIAIVACLTPFKSVEVHGTCAHDSPHAREKKRVAC